MVKTLPAQKPKENNMGLAIAALYQKPKENSMGLDIVKLHQKS
jgi:hypothetical protein